MIILTVVTTQDKPKNGLEAEQVQEVPRQTGDPSDIKITGHDTRLKHGFESDRQGEREFHYIMNMNIISPNPAGCQKL